MSFTVFGGTLRPGIDLSISGKLPVSDETVQANIKNTATLGLPSYRDYPKAAVHRLAVVGGGPSISRHVETLKGWDGDIWAINGAYAWCRQHLIEATFFALDPHPIVARWAKGAKKAILETRCDPSAFETLKGAEVTLCDIGAGPGEIRCGSSTVTAAPHLAIRMGYRHVTLFGCESSYPLNATHAYTHEARPEELVVRCGGQEFLTAPDYYMQALELSRFIREVPAFVTEQSGGLLRAMIADPEFRVTWVSDELARNISALNAPQPAIPAAIDATHDSPGYACGIAA
jgi:hypothetical protein